jgi:hypothetical protein
MKLELSTGEREEDWWSLEMTPDIPFSTKTAK